MIRPPVKIVAACVLIALGTMAFHLSPLVGPLLPSPHLALHLSISVTL